MRPFANKLHTQGLIMRKIKQVEVNGPVPNVSLSNSIEPSEELVVSVSYKNSVRTAQ
jgi:hypothetical protein